MPGGIDTDTVRNVTVGSYARKVLTMGKPLETAGQPESCALSRPRT